EQLGARSVHGSVECGKTQGLPEQLDCTGRLSALCQPLRNSHPVIDLPSLPAQPGGNGDDAQAFHQAQAPCAQDGAQQMQGRGQGAGAQGKAVIGGVQLQALAQEQVLHVQAQLLHQCQCLGVGPQQYVLAIV